MYYYQSQTYYLIWLEVDKDAAEFPSLVSQFVNYEMREVCFGGCHAAGDAYEIKWEISGVEGREVITFNITYETYGKYIAFGISERNDLRNVDILSYEGEREFKSISNV